MASRRMKMKVAVNIGPGRGGPARSGMIVSSTSEQRNLPTTPVATSNDCDPETVVVVTPIPDTTLSPVYNPKSPVKTFSSFHFPTSPVKTAAATAHRSISESEPEEEDTNNVFVEDEVAAFSLVAVSPRRDPSPSPPPSRSSSPVKSITTVATLDEFRRGPGTGPSLKPSTNTHILNNIQKEIGAIHVGHVTSNETLRQRLQRGVGGTSSTKYSILRKEFLATTKNKNPEKKDLTILHFTFWNPPNKQESKKSDVDDLFEGIDTSVMKTLESLPDPRSPDEVLDSTEVKKPVGPRVKVGPDGELIIDEQSLVVETSESVRAKKQLSEMETVMAASSGYYRHKRNPRRGYDWSVKETVRFFKALTMCGTDFSMMAHLFPNRSRAELKAKFKREDRKNSQLVSQALSFQSFDPMESITESESEDNDEPLTKKRRSAATLPIKSKTDQLNLSVLMEQEEESRNENTKTSGIPSVTQQPDPPPSTNKEQQLAIYPMNSLSHAPPPPLSFEDSSSVLLKTRKNMKISTSKKKKLAKLTKVGTDRVPLGRPMGIGDSMKIKKAFKLEKKRQREANRDKSDNLEKKEIKKTSLGKKKSKVKEEDVKVKKPRKLKRPKTEKTEPDSIPLQNVPCETEDPCLEILRFDPNDPLGFKIVQGQIDKTLLEVTTDHPPLHCKNLEDVQDVTPEEITTNNETLVVLKESDRVPPVPSTRRSIKVKVKPRIPRVPGGGGPIVLAENVVQGEDEIEIEISCL